MAALTLRHRYVKALEARGEKIVKETSKYIVMTRTLNERTNLFFYIGRAGSLRTGSNRTNSIPVSDAFKASLLAPKDVGNE